MGRDKEEREEDTVEIVAKAAFVYFDNVDYDQEGDHLAFCGTDPEDAIIQAEQSLDLYLGITELHDAIAALEEIVEKDTKEVELRTSLAQKGYEKLKKLKK